MLAANGEFLGAKTRRADGMYVGESPVLAALLLAGEPPASLAALGGASLFNFPRTPIAIARICMSSVSASSHHANTLQYTTHYTLHTC